MDQAAVLTEYTELRRKMVEVSTRLVQTLNKEDIGTAASAMGILHGKHIDLETKDELSVVMDYAIHNCYHGGKNALDRLLQQDPYPDDSAELRLLEAMKRSHFTVFEVTNSLPGFGIHGFDGPKKIPIVIVDRGLSMTATPGMALGTRILSPGEGWWMTTGAALPISQKALDLILRDFADYTRQHGTEPPAPDRERIVRRACIAAGASHQIRYTKIGEFLEGGGPIAPIQRDSRRTGRNDPCPCGSGKKYKKCCGN